jgi:hypothetical protein
LFGVQFRNLIEKLTRVKIDWSKLGVIGPVRAYRWKYTWREQEVDIELWVLHDDIKFLELSIKTESSKVKETQKFLDLLLKSHRLREAKDPVNKTSFVFKLFSH